MVFRELVGIGAGCDILEEVGKLGHANQWKHRELQRVMRFQKIAGYQQLIRMHDVLGIMYGQRGKLPVALLLKQANLTDDVVDVLRFGGRARLIVNDNMYVFIALFQFLRNGQGGGVVGINTQKDMVHRAGVTGGCDKVINHIAQYGILMPGGDRNRQQLGWYGFQRLKIQSLFPPELPQNGGDDVPDEIINAHQQVQTHQYQTDQV